jgi:hypothetical protein
MDDHSRLTRAEKSLDVGFARQIVVAAARDHDVSPAVPTQSVDDAAPEEARAARHHGGSRGS